MDGVKSIEVEGGRIGIDFDALKITEETVRTISKESVEKLGYKVFDEE